MNITFISNDNNAYMPTAVRLCAREEKEAKIKFCQLVVKRR